MASTNTVVIAGVELSRAAAECIEQMAAPAAAVAADLDALRSGKRTAETLLAHCLDGADEDREEGWREYVDALVDAVSSCASCGSHPAETDGLCSGCAHGVAAHGALRATAYAVECDCLPCECGEATGERCAWSGPAHETVVLEWMPEEHRASHKAAGGNFGVYPHNGAVRLRCERSCAERLVESDGPDWARIVEAR
jgi:hypothetical protein